MVQMILFFVFAALAVFGGILVITQRNPVYSAIALIVTFFALAGEYILLQAHFIAVVHVAVYAGAIMVLFLFVIMLLNVRVEEKAPGAFRYMIFLGLPLVVLLLLELGYLIYQGFHGQTVKGNELGTVTSIGNSLFSTYILPFEITSILLIVAMVGALYLSKRNLSAEKE